MRFFIRWAVFFILGIILVVAGIKVYSRRATARISPLPNRKRTEINIPALFTKKKNPDELTQQIQKLVDGKLVNYSVFVKDLQTDFTIGINESVIYPGASINKVPIVASLYYYANKGEVDLDKKITLQQDDVQDYGTGSLRYDQPGSVYSVKTLAKLMIQQSDNTAAYILSNQILTVDKIQSLINSWGLTQTDMINNKTSNKDTEIVMEKIYKGQVANKANTQELLAFFQNTDFEDRLPALLPSETKVYHKIGNAEGATHDVGIVEAGSIQYYIGIFTNDIADEAGTVNLMAKISKLVYLYLKT